MIQPQANVAMAQEDPAAAQGGKGDAQPLPPPGLGPRKNAQGQQGQQQQKRPPLPKVSNMGTFGKWNVQCADMPGDQEQQDQAGRSCGMTQQNKSEKNEKVAISVIVNKVKRGDKSALFMRIMTPVGVYLPTGIPVEIDGTALPSRLIFTRCVPPICEAMGEMSAETLAKFKKGSASVFYLYDRPGNGYPIKISLEGFGAAAAELDKY
ncbi:MAG: invasion associated locus B family protein [Rhizobiales bacterium]|nr:invasion associated locus B family protein [Hyphomicrobiales bacterium]